MRLARAVGAQDSDPVAEPHLEVERRHELLAGRGGQREALADHGPLAGATSAQAHGHGLLDRLRLGRTGLLELGQSGPGGLQPRGQAVVVGGLRLVVLHQRLELGVLLVPPPGELVEPFEPSGARLVVGREAARMRPRRVARPAELDRHDHIGGVRQQLAVVADQQHRLGGLLQPLLEPELPRDVEVVVRLVEQEDVVGAAEQCLEDDPLLLAARERGQLAGTGPGRRARPARRPPRRPRRPRARSPRPDPSRRSRGRSASEWARRRHPSSPARLRRARRQPRPGPAAPRPAGGHAGSRRPCARRTGASRPGIRPA